MVHEAILEPMGQIYLQMLMIVVSTSLFLRTQQICHRRFQITLHRPILLRPMHSNLLLVKTQNF